MPLGVIQRPGLCVFLHNWFFFLFFLPASQTSLTLVKSDLICTSVFFLLTCSFPCPPALRPCALYWCLRFCIRSLILLWTCIYFMKLWSQTCSNQHLHFYNTQEEGFEQNFTSILAFHLFGDFPPPHSNAAIVLLKQMHSDMILYPVTFANTLLTLGWV